MFLYYYGIFSGHFPIPNDGIFHHVGIFPIIFLFPNQNLPLRKISKEEFFPPCRNFSPFPSYIPGKIPSLLTEGIPAYLIQKIAVGGSKNIPLTAEGIIRRM
jgi:hypothetical protein